MLATLDRPSPLLLVCGAAVPTSDLLFVCALDLPTLKNVRLSLQTLELLAFPQNRIRVVLNRANSKVGMKPGEVEGALEVKVRFELRSDGTEPLAVNRGAPLVLADDKADFSRAMREMAKGLSPTEAVKVQKRRLFSRA